jgi:hypothetical protein
MLPAPMTRTFMTIPFGVLSRDAGLNELYWSSISG